MSQRAYYPPPQSFAGYLATSKLIPVCTEIIADLDQGLSKLHLAGVGLLQRLRGRDDPGCLGLRLVGLLGSGRPAEGGEHHRGADAKHRKRFWNAVGSFGSYYPLPYDAILRENEDAFASRQCRPLAPTLAPGIYAHWFRSEGKEIYTVYNGTGHTFHGLALSVELPPDRQHLLILKFVEGLSNAEIGQIMGKTEGAVKSLYHRTLLTLRDELVGVQASSELFGERGALERWGELG